MQLCRRRIVKLTPPLMNVNIAQMRGVVYANSDLSELSD